MACVILDGKETARKTRERLKVKVDELKSKAGKENIILCLAGNKCDVPPERRKVQFAEAKQFADKNNMIFFNSISTHPKSHSVHPLSRCHVTLLETCEKWH